MLMMHTRNRNQGLRIATGRGRSSVSVIVPPRACVFVGNNERGLISADGFQSNGTVGYILDTPRETSDSFTSLVRSLGPSHVHASKQPIGSIHFLVGLCLHATSQKNDHRILLTNPLLSDTLLSADFCVCSSGEGTVGHQRSARWHPGRPVASFHFCSSSRLDLLMIVALSAIGKTAALPDSSTDQAQRRQSNCCRINQSSRDERSMREHQVCCVFAGK
jgi:hypothetical protein